MVLWVALVGRLGGLWEVQVALVGWLGLPSRVLGGPWGVPRGPLINQKSHLS